jgi:hypothetical protein
MLHCHPGPHPAAGLPPRRSLAAKAWTGIFAVALRAFLEGHPRRRPEGPAGSLPGEKVAPVGRYKNELATVKLENRE